MNRTRETGAALIMVIGLSLAPAVFAQDTTGVGAVRGVVADTRQVPVRDVALCLGGTGLCTTSDRHHWTPPTQQIGRLVEADGASTRAFI